MADQIATLSKEGDISIIKLDDGKANAFSYDMLSQVNELLAKVPRDSGALVITGREGLFSGGFDLKTLATGDMEKITKMVQLGYNLLLELFSFDRPIVAAVSGHSIALGLFVTCSADYRIAIDGKYVCLTTEFKPYFYVKLPPKDYKTWASILHQKMCRLCPELNFDYSIIK